LKKYILAIDQGTTSSRALIFDHSGQICSKAQHDFEQHFPEPGWVEHDATEIWNTQLEVIWESINKTDINISDISAFGITNQRETTVVWDRESGEPVHNAIVWQDRRTSELCKSLKNRGLSEKFRQKTGLIIDAYFSATKLAWILDNVHQARDKANAGQLAFGTIDSWLVWKLTGGKRHITDVSNASRTMLFNINSMEWDDEILKILDIPESVLPEVCSSSEVYAKTDESLFAEEIPISSIIGDQQSALFGQRCFKPGMVKNTYGTGAFMMLNTGNKPIESRNNLLTTIAWKLDGKVTYALEGSVFIAGAVVQWLRDQLEMFGASGDIEELAAGVPDSGGVCFVPAFTGLGAPHWDPLARGLIIGLTRGTNSGHIARAALESIAYQVSDVLKAMEMDSAITINELRVDGGATENNLLMQFQSDILDIPLIRPEVHESTAFGAACLAGLAVGFWNDIKELENMSQSSNTFLPAIENRKAENLLKQWHRGVKRAKNWAE
jgi:glycerol kinase